MTMASMREKSAELYACLMAREFPAQALLRLRPELRNLPCAVMQGEPPLQHVCSLNSKAYALGVAPGMNRVEMDTFPSVTVLPRSRAQESAAKAVLLECMETFSPRVDSPGTNHQSKNEERAFLCVLDIDGTEKLLGQPDKLATALLERVQALGVVACVAISGNFHAAVCLAKGMPPEAGVAVIPAGEESTALAPLPLAVLGLCEEQAETFSLWGIRTLGMLAALPEKDLIARMGQEGKRLRSLAQGNLPHLFLPVETAFTLEERMELDFPVELLDPLLFVISTMLEQLILRAAARTLALASVTVTLSLQGGAAHTRTVRPALPLTDRQLWLKLLHLDLQAHPPPAAVLSLTLAAEPGSTSKVQLGLFSPQVPEPMRLEVTLARIRAIVGEDRVGRAVLQDTHQPDSFRMEPFTIPAPSNVEIVSTQPASALRQLRPPEAATVTLRDCRPETFIFHGKKYAVEHAYGPWLTSGEWWNPELWELEQWDLVARAKNEDDALFCCCLARDLLRDCWQVMALYD
ncbi:MAG: DNA polymerase Y family protein [Acidobacteriaceae bacterium]